MFLTADELIAPGGPSAPVWAFFTAISLAIIGLFSQQIAAKRQAKEARDEATKAVEGAEKAALNTASLGNGFAGKVVGRLDDIITRQDKLSDALREHLEWHLHDEGKK